MRSDELIAKIRLACFLPDEAAAPEFSDEVLRSELNDKLKSLFSESIIKAAAGYWERSFEFVTTPGKQRYRMPSRALMGGLIAVERKEATRWKPLDLLDQRDATSTETSDIPYGFYLKGETIYLQPAPSAAVTIRLRHYIRPSELKISQSSTQGGAGADRGRVTVVDANTVQVNTLPYDYSLAMPSVISSSNQQLDIISAEGWHEVLQVDLTQTLSGTTISFPVGTDLSDVQVGDYVRVAEQTDWPPLPDEACRILCDAASRKVLLALDDLQKAQMIEDAISGDLTRFLNSLEPRVQTQMKRIPIYLRGRSCR